jgi:hypothetical protein
MDFRRTRVFSVKKADINANFAANEIIDRRTQHNSLSRDKNKHWVTNYVMDYKAMSAVTLLRMRELSPAPTVVT